MDLAQQEDQKHQQFDSFSEKSSDSENQQQSLYTEQILTFTKSHSKQKSFQTKKISFPPPQPKTLELYEVYQRNQKLINQLRDKIKQLQQIKIKSLYIEECTPAFDIEDQVSEFVAKSQQLYQERQNQLQTIKQQYQFAKSEQLKIALLKSNHLPNLTQNYFRSYRHVIEAKFYQNFIVTLTYEKRVNKHKKAQKGTNQCNKDLNKTQSKKRKYSGQSDDNSKSSSKLKCGGKASFGHKPKYFIRLLVYGQIFSEITSKRDQKGSFCLPLLLTEDQRPISFSFDQRNQIILVLMSSKEVFLYQIQNLSPEEAPQSKAQIKNATNIKANLKLVKLESSIKLDDQINVKFFEVKDKSLYIASNDGIVRCYQVIGNKQKKSLHYELRVMSSVFNYSKQLGKISNFSFFNGSKEELLFVSQDYILCKLDLKRYKSEIIHKFKDKIINVSSAFIKTQKQIFLRYQIKGCQITFKQSSQQQLLVYENIKKCMKKWQQKQTALQERFVGESVKQETQKKEQNDNGMQKPREKHKFTFEKVFSALQKQKQLLFLGILKHGDILGWCQSPPQSQQSINMVQKKFN